MRTHGIRTAAVTSTLLTVTAAHTNQALAQDPWSFSANIGAVSNYIWRGVTQTSDQAAVQGGLDVTHESGFYAGTWVSNVDFDDGAAEEISGIVAYDPETDSFATDDDGNLIVTGTTSGSDPASANYELDLYLGYSGTVNDDFSYDISGIYYAYPDGRDSDFAEIGASGTYKWFTLGLAYTVYGENDGGPFDDGDWYFYGGAEVKLPYDFGFSVRGGYYDFSNDEETILVTGDGTLLTQTNSYDYWHYGASISREAGDFGTFSLNWDQNDGDQDLGFDTDAKIWVGWNKEF